MESIKISIKSERRLWTVRAKLELRVRIDLSWDENEKNSPAALKWIHKKNCIYIFVSFRAPSSTFYSFSHFTIT